MMTHPSYPPHGTLPPQWPSWTNWPTSSPSPPSLLRPPAPIATGGTDPLLLSRDYRPLDFQGFDAETDPQSLSIGAVAAPPGWEPREVVLPTEAPVLISPRMRRREQRHHFFRRMVRTLLVMGASLLMGIMLSTIFFVVHVLPLFPPFSASSPLGTWTPIRHATVVPRSTSLVLPTHPTPLPQRPPDLTSQTGGRLKQTPALVRGGEDACLVGTSHVEDSTGKGELDTQVVQQTLSSSHLQMFVRVEPLAQTSVAILSETQFGQVEQSIYGSQDLGPTPPGGIESPTSHEFCSLYLIADTTHDWVAIGGKAGVAPFTTGEYQAAMTLYHQVEQATGGRHTGAVLAVLAYFHSLLLASASSSSSSPMTP